MRTLSIFVWEGGDDVGGQVGIIYFRVYICLCLCLYSCLNMFRLCLCSSVHSFRLGLCVRMS